MFEYYKKIEKIEGISTCEYCTVRHIVLAVSFEIVLSFAAKLFSVKGVEHESLCLTTIPNMEKTV